jgi:hypothetical protein
MTTVDAVLATRAFPPPTFLKLDVQGYEIEVLEGAPRALQTAEVLLLEVSVWPFNEGAPLLHDVVSYLRQKGFRTYDICDFSYRPSDRVLLQTDMIFVREDSALLADRTTRYRFDQP